MMYFTSTYSLSLLPEDPSVSIFNYAFRCSLVCNPITWFLCDRGKCHRKFDLATVFIVVKPPLTSNLLSFPSLTLHPSFHCALLFTLFASLPLGTLCVGLSLGPQPSGYVLGNGVSSVAFPPTELSLVPSSQENEHKTNGKPRSHSSMAFSQPDPLLSLQTGPGWCARNTWW